MNHPTARDEPGNAQAPALSPSKTETSATPRKLDPLIITLCAGAILGLILIAQGRMRDDQFILPAHSPNDRSRWATIIALVDHGTYAIDDVAFAPNPDGGEPRKTHWYTIDMVRRPTDGHYLSSKPPLLPTILAGEYWLLKTLSGGRLNFTDHPHALVRTIVVTANLVPLVIFLLLYTRLLDRLTDNLWVRSFAMLSAGAGTYLTGFSVTLNNHTIAACCGFFALHAALRIWLDDRKDAWFFALTGFFGSLASTLELPALAMAACLFLALLCKDSARALRYALPAALVPLAAHCYTTYQVTGSLMPTYGEKEWYVFEGSYWKIDPESGRLMGTTKDPKTSIDNQHEPWYVYLFHMVLGHHGVFSLTPIFLFSALGLGRTLARCDRSWSPVAALALVLTALIVAFYTIAPAYGLGQRNYGGMCHGMRWLFWLIPFWLVFLPAGIEWRVTGRGYRALAIISLFISAASAFYASRNPWTRPWLHELLHQAGWILY